MSSSPNEATSMGDPINEIIETLSRERVGKNPPYPRISKEVVQQAAKRISDDPSLADRVLPIIFPSGVSADKSFFDGLAEIERRLGHNDSVNRFNGLIWARAFSRLPSEDGVELLNSLAHNDSRSFFVGLSALPSLLESVTLPAYFLASWIIAVRTRLGQDMASFGFWGGLRSLTHAFPETILEVTSILSSDPADENTINVAAYLLGCLRAAEASVSGVTDLIFGLRDHQHADRRLIYHRSWVTLGLQRPLTESEFSDALNRMSMGTKAEVEEAFNLIRVLLPRDTTTDPSFLLGFRWLHGGLDRVVGDLWKYYVIQLVRETYTRSQLVCVPAGLPPSTNLVIVVFPIRDDNAVTWDELEELFVFLLDKDPAGFRTLLFDLAKKESELLSKRFRGRDTFHQIKSASIPSKHWSIAVEALLSDNERIRHLGFALFEGLGLSELNDERLINASDDRIAILIFAFQCEPFFDEVIARFLLAIEPRVRAGSKELQDLFMGELTYQSKNLPGGCLEALKKKSRESALVRRPVEESERYFDSLRSCVRSAINSMGIPGLERAIRVKAARQSREMRAQMKKVSVFAQFCSTSYTLYGGKEWRTYMGGKLGEISQMQEISHSAEFPRMPGIDPEGIAIRRHEAKLMIRALLATESIVP